MPAKYNRVPWFHFRQWLQRRFTENELVGAYDEPSSNPIAQFLQARIGRQFSVSKVQIWVYGITNKYGWGGPPPEWVKLYLKVTNTHTTIRDRVFSRRMKQRTALKILQETIEIYRKNNG